MHNSGYNETANDTRRRLDLRGLSLRRLEFGDLPYVAEVESRSFSSPWSSGMFALEMSKPDSLCLIATAPGDDSHVYGYIVFSRYDLAWHLMNIAVALGTSPISLPQSSSGRLLVIIVLRVS